MFKAGNYEKAIAHFSSAIGIEPSHVLYSNRSASHCGMRQYGDALKDAESCIGLKGDWGKARARAASHPPRARPSLPSRRARRRATVARALRCTGWASSPTPSPPTRRGSRWSPGSPCWSRASTTPRPRPSGAAVAAAAEDGLGALWWPTLRMSTPPQWWPRAFKLSSAATRGFVVRGLSGTSKDGEDMTKANGTYWPDPGAKQMSGYSHPFKHELGKWTIEYCWQSPYSSRHWWCLTEGYGRKGYTRSGADGSLYYYCSSRGGYTTGTPPLTGWMVYRSCGLDGLPGRTGGTAPPPSLSPTTPAQARPSPRPPPPPAAAPVRSHP